MARAAGGSTSVVQLPRAEAAKWWGRDWKELLAALESGEIPEATLQHGALRAPDNFALLREVNGRAFLLSQGW